MDNRDLFIASVEKRKKWCLSMQAQILHRIQAGMKRSAEIANDIGLNMATTNNYLRTLESRGDINRVKIPGNIREMSFIQDSIGLMVRFPKVEYLNQNKILPGGRIVSLLDRPSTWNAQPLRPAPRVFVSGEQAWR